MAITLVFSTFTKDTDFKMQRIGTVQAMAVQALTKHYIILFLNNFNSCLQTVIIVSIAFGVFSTFTSLMIKRCPVLNRL